ncbi:HlyD family secretion protein [Salinarimonas soli]|uniref:HlyD family efflux transporter periplasmic adaptor subunit n=1 Tax=Salinarimonas soli TaxID=1638099 RepID=A0A5B2VCG4_9HYPH|nr:HlyD family efflux transporter periplasmic adaptor subunit [Salinarimonas soli]KAA2236102.1 HlyD family efflux transporter periplasmic adaptor subunit [Salinarimonas soli]
MFLNSRPTRSLVGVLLFGVAVLALLPGMKGYTSLDGTVNARVAVVSAPIDGTIQFTPAKVGTPVADGQALVSIRNDRVNRAVLASLAAEARTAGERADALVRERDELVRLRATLGERLEAYQAATVETLEREVTILRRRIEVSRAQEIAAQSEFTRRQTLGGSGIVSASAVEQARAAEITSTGQIDVTRLQIEQLEYKLAAVRRGVFVGDGQNDVPYSRQRGDEVSVRIADIDTRIAENLTRAAQIEEQRREEDARVRSLTAAVLSSSFTGVVWRNNVVSGSNVVLGNELVRLLDCRDLFVDILLPEVDYDEIYPGRAAEVRLLGRSATVPAEVLSVRGSAAATEEVTLAAVPPAAKGRSARIRLALHQSDLNTDFGNHCQVGRSVQVRFESRSLPLRRWMSSLWFSIS